MNLVDALFTAGGGGVFGSLLHLGSSFFETWRKKKEAEVEIMVMKAKVEAAEKEFAWKAFTASQSQQDSLSELPKGVHPIVANIYALVAAFRAFTRPGITWALLLILVVIFFHTSPYDRQEMLGEITFAAFTSLFWYFGARYSKTASK